MAERPNSLLHDGWGSPRPLDEAGQARANRRLFWADLARIAVLGLLAAGMMGMLVWALLAVSRL